MTEDNKLASMAETYYRAMGNKDFLTVEKFLHPDIQLISPLSQLKGKKAYLEALEGFVNFFETLTIRTKFGKDDQAIIVVDVDFPLPIGKVPTVVLMTFQEAFITRIEIFHDTKPLEKAKNDLTA